MHGRTPPAVQILETEEHRVRVVPVVSGLRNPWGLAFLPGGDVLVTEKGGRVRLVRGGALQPQPVAELGHTAAQAALDLTRRGRDLPGEQHQQLATRLVLRGSTAVPRP